MARFIMFSRRFPNKHINQGEPTFFVEKFWAANKYALAHEALNEQISNVAVNFYEPKHHTIRAGHYWRAGQFFSPRVWAGKPYYSNHVTIAPDVEIVAVYSFQKDLLSPAYLLNGKALTTEQLETVAANDGLTLQQFLSWFKHPAPFDGQIICWSNEIKQFYDNV